METPTTDRELRGFFVTTAWNTDWPSQAGQPEDVADDEINAIIGRALELNCNAIFLQVRAFGDRTYTGIDPKYLGDPKHQDVPWAISINSGEKDPGYDPLRKWCKAAHDAGLQVHAWFNPFRLDRPVKDYPCFDGKDGYIYLDWTSARVQEYVVNLIDDLLANYKPPTDVALMRQQKHPPAKTLMILQPSGATTGPGGGGGGSGSNGDGDDDGLDGVVVDHYYPDPDTKGPNTAAPVTPADFARVVYASTADPASDCPPLKRIELNKRRHWALTNAEPQMLPKKPPVKDQGINLNTFMQKASETVRCHGAEFGVTPDCRLMKETADWMTKGYLDYVIPEIYIKNGGFAAKLKEWTKLNTGQEPKPDIYPAVFTERVQRPEPGDTRWSPDQIEKSLDDVANANDATVKGHVHFSYRALRSPAQAGPRNLPQDDHNIGDRLKNGKYKHAAVAPERQNLVWNNWPTITPDGSGNYTLKFDDMKPRRWVYWFHTKGGGWNEMYSTPKSKPVIKKKDVPANTDRIAAKAIDAHNHETLVGTRDIP
jgi:Glycosyl hydrolase-like 10